MTIDDLVMFTIKSGIALVILVIIDAIIQRIKQKIDRKDMDDQ